MAGWILVLFSLALIPFIRVYADDMDTNGGIWFYDNLGNLTAQISNSIISTTNMQLGGYMQLTSTTLPVCNSLSAGQSRRSTNKNCYCNGTAWKDIAPPAVTILGIDVLSVGTCP